MRLLALCTDRGVPVDGAKGATVHLVELWRALAHRGAHIVGLAPWRGGTLPSAPPGLEIGPVRMLGAGDHEFALRLRHHALDWVGRARPQAVLERLALGSRLGLEIRQRTGAPLVVEVNAPLDREAARYRVPPTPEELDALRDTLQGADRVYCVSRGLIEWARGQGAPEGRLELLANGVDVGRFGPPAPAAGGAGRQPTPAAEGDSKDVCRLRTGFTGSFKPWHGLEHLIEGVGLVRARGIDLGLELLGDGPGRPQLEERARALGLGAHVRFLGARPHEQVPAFLHGLDIAVAPAAAEEDYYFSPLKLFEYAAAGCAIVAPAAGEVPEWLRHGDEAWLVRPADPAALADAFARLASDPALRRSLGAAARARAEREFGWDRVAERIIGWVRQGRRDDAAPVGTPERGRA
ncbi:MAG: glycosyltransferase family 4 protein [Candidatus Eiseniibacteriota bacterium]